MTHDAGRIASKDLPHKGGYPNVVWSEPVGGG